MPEIITLNMSTISRISQADVAINEMAERYLPLTIADAKDKKGFIAVHDARMTVRNKRIEIEKTRKELKAEALEYGRQVDSEAKRITALLEPIETHLQTQEDGYKAEIERIKREAEESARQKLQLRVDALLAVGFSPNVALLSGMTDDDFEATLAAQTEKHQKELAEREAARIEQEKAEAERHRVAELERVERERIEAEQLAKLEAEQAEVRKQQAAMQAERERLDAERRRLAEEQAKVEAEKAEAARVERQRIENEAAAERAKQAERDRLAREKEMEIQREESELAAKARAEELRPIKDRLMSVADAVAAVIVPDIDHPAADTIATLISDTADAIRHVVGRIK